MSWVSRLTSLFRKRRLDADLDDELRFHLEMEEQENVRNGMSADEARRRARMRLGGLEQVKESYRERRGLPFLESLFQDLRFALRSLRKTPGVTAAALLTLTLGIGIGTTIFSVANAVLLKPLPYKDPDRLVMLQWVKQNAPTQANETFSIPGSELLEWQHNMEVFEGMAVFPGDWMPVASSLEPPERVVAQRCSPGFLSLLGVQPMLGRDFTPDEHRQSAHVLILQYDIWKRAFHGGPDIIGKTVRLGSTAYTVIGVMPHDFLFFSRATDMLIPIPDLSSGDTARRSVKAIARLKAGVTLEQAQAWADAFSKALDSDRPEAFQGWRVRLVTLSDVAAAEFKPALLALLGAVTGVILIMCANLANLFLVKANRRAKELAVRAAMGASRARLVRLLLTESLILSAAGAAFGLAVCANLLPVLQAIVPSPYTNGEYLIQLDSIGIDGTVVLFAVSASLCAGLVFGLVPAIRSSRHDLSEGLKDVGHTSSGRGTPRLQKSLAVAQVAVSLVLAVGAILLVRSVVKLYSQGPGYRTEGLLHLHVRWPSWAFTDVLPGPEASPNERAQAETALALSFWRDVFDRVNAAVGVKSVSAGGSTFIGYVEGGPITVEAGIEQSDQGSFTAFADTVTPNYFRAMGIPLLEGRIFGAADRLDGPPVVLVNEQAAQRFWPGEDPVGKRLKRGNAGSRNVWLQVVGVVGNVRLNGMDEPAPPVVYMSTTQDLRYVYGLHLLVRTDGEPSAVAPAVVAAIRDVNPNAVIRDVRPVQGYVDDWTWERRLAMHLLVGLAGLALLLATVGVYGVLSHAVGERTREIGIRMALGADRRTVIGAVLRQGLVVAVFGLVVGLGLAAIVTRFLRSLLYGVEPLDPATLIVSAAALLAGALLASYLPGRRAAKVDPMAALRSE